MSNVIETPAPTTPAPIPFPNAYTADAVERMVRLQQMSADFPAETDPRPLTRSELTIASRTSPQALEKAAVLAQAAPHLASGVFDSNKARDAAAFEMAYAGVRDEAYVLYRRVELAILRHKLEPAIATRNLYGMAKVLARVDALIRTHVADLRRALSGTRRKKPVPPPSDVVEPTAAKK